MQCVCVCVFQTLAGLPDQDSYYDMVDCLEEQGIEAMAQRHLSRKGTDLDLVEQFNIYEVRKPLLTNTCLTRGHTAGHMTSHSLTQQKLNDHQCCCPCTTCIHFVHSACFC